MKLAIVILLALWLLSGIVCFLMVLPNRNPYRITPDWEALTGVISFVVAVLSFIGFAVCLTWHLL